MIRTPLLLEVTPSARSFEKKAFRRPGTGVFHVVKLAGSIGPQVRTKGFGNPRDPSKKNVPRAGGALRLEPKPPVDLSRLKQVGPLNKQRRLLADHHDET